MEQLLGTSLPVFIVLTLIIMGFAAYMTGQSLAVNWHPVWQLVIYCCLLGFANRFLVFSLFEGELLSLSGYLIDTAALLAIGLLAYRFARARKTVAQYPWLYERAGPFGWREKQ